jgi:two-component system CheB/CheR fusion protein
MPPNKPVAKAAPPRKPERLSAAGRGAKAGAAEKPAPAKSPPARTAPFPIAGIGASAGGLDAFTHLLGHLPGDTGLAFVLVQHLDPNHDSVLPELLSRATAMPVQQVADGMPIEPNHIYVIPPNTSMGVLRGRLSLVPRTESRGQHMPIDFFFRSLADDLRNRAIGVILSGTASDGTEGLRAIKAEGGLTIAQDEKTARYGGMPHSAIAAGVVDFVLPPEGIALELARIGRHPYLALAAMPKLDEESPGSEAEVNKVFVLLRAATGVDFSLYKPTTLKRRIARRMALQKVESLARYARFLAQTPAEVDALYQDLLINVTSFFREPKAFELLKSKIFPRLMKDRPPRSPIRIWVPGCSTGEEVYSLAMCLLEFLEHRTANTPIQIFATDLSDRAIQKARQGVYPAGIAEDVGPGRLRRYFIKHPSGYQVSKTVRDLCVFARQDVTKDPPFSRLDLVSCRNLLIYLGPELQKRVIPVFHYALKSTGVLLLGGSETIGGFADLFALMDRRHKIYARKSTPHRMELGLASRSLPVPETPPGGSAPPPPPRPPRSTFNGRPTASFWPTTLPRA